jgi:dihydroneopterin aldolase
MQPDYQSPKNIHVLGEEDLVSLFFQSDYQCIIGVKPEERILAQKLSIEAEIKIDKNHIGDRDWLFMVDHLITEAIIDFRPLLLERLALVIGEKIISFLPPLSRLKLTIKKPQALPYAQHAYVSLYIRN